MICSNKKQLIRLIILAVIASLCCYYGVNCILSDIANMFYMTITRDVITSIPMVFVAVQLVALFLCGIDNLTSPERIKRSRRLCSVNLTVLSVMGLAATLISYFGIYTSFSAPSPFKGAGVIFLIYYVIALAASLTACVRFSKNRDSEDKICVSAGNIIYRILRFIFVFYAFDRFGALLFSPVYIQQRTLHLTFPFYISLILPITLVIVMVYCGIGYREKASRPLLIPAIVILIANIVLTAAVVIIGSAHPEFVSAISPAMPLERLVTTPVDLIAQFSLVTLLSVYAIIFSAVRRKQQ